MNIDAKKLQIIQQVLQSNSISQLEEVSLLLQKTTSGAASSSADKSQTTARASQTSTSKRTSVDELDALIAKNMPGPEKSLSIEEIRAIAENAEKALQAGSDNTNAILKAITDNDLK